MEIDRSGLELLSRQECLRLLATTGIGRIGIHAAALPVILPVAYVVDDASIVVRVGSGSQLDSATRDAVVAFEADYVDPGEGDSWSVSVTGVTRHVTDHDELERVKRLPLGEWAGDAADRFVCISLEMVSGRRRALAVQSADANCRRAVKDHSAGVGALARRPKGQSMRDVRP